VFTFLNRKKKNSNKRKKDYQNTSDLLDSLSDVGLSRGNNEDSVLTIIHPTNPSLKLLAVADGVGGKECGEIASNFAVDTLEKWFLNLSENHINNSAYISRSLLQMIKFINNYLYIVKSYRTGCGTTLTCAIINEKETIIANVGDSRAYIVKDEEMKQVTRDDSLVWYYYELGEISKEEIRFHRNSRLITKSIGPDFNVDPDIIRISNKSYDGIFLFTDGVTDCLSDSKIEHIVTNSKKINLAKEIIKEAVYGQPIEKAPIGKEFYIPKNGKDNASVALYLKSNQKSYV
jgi:Serine/threonine protein phosphatase